ncbi:hypothetical protein MKW98_022064 [Papaver atlanticum]|uniref:Uncharacterized protein n=1 Tax=Papaver atlanticum TaxID=357466 RepID=A0AAD4XZS4_9MAGN|nr:hypothetical protein MKW98_022064 [Papaver atlanticum]
MRVISTKRSPFGSSKTLGFVEGAQRIRRYVFDLDAYRSGKIKGVDLKEGMTIKELEETFAAMSWEDVRKVNWDKYSRNVRPFELTRTGETERVIQKMMDKEFEDRDDERIDVKLDAKEMEV